jgi:hypothetical protein
VIISDYYYYYYYYFLTIIDYGDNIHVFVFVFAATAAANAGIVTTFLHRQADIMQTIDIERKNKFIQSHSCEKSIPFFVCLYWMYCNYIQFL